MTRMAVTLKAGPLCNIRMKSSREKLNFQSPAASLCAMLSIMQEIININVH